MDSIAVSVPKVNEQTVNFQLSDLFLPSYLNCLVRYRNVCYTWHIAFQKKDIIMQDNYSDFGISPAVSAYCAEILAPLRERFDAIDAVAEANQLKVLKAMQSNRVDAACFAGTTGYGYDDVGRDTLERVYAAAFHTESALVRPQLVCGTHALAVALSANLLPGDELLSPVGKPYDTLE